MFNYFKTRRDERSAERAAGRAHQLAMIDGIKSTLETLVEAQAEQTHSMVEGLMALAKANEANAQGFTAWLNQFRVTDTPTTSVVRDEDEYDAEQRRVAERLGVPPDALDDIPEEFRLALSLKNGFEADVRGD